MFEMARWLSCVALTASVIGCECARAEDDGKGVDTEYLFGFVTGTDIGDVGEKELESTTIDRIGKRTGSYRALSQ
jgi:hypothetical protein